jgi:hypothetical protein
MARKPNVRKLPERERRESLNKFLEVLAAHPDLAHFRTWAPGAPERQLALFAALERAAFRGNAATAPPAHDDLPDQLLCDILDVIDRDPELSRHGSAYGPDRHCANLLAFGAWTGQPHAIELFTAAVSHLTAAQTTTYPSLEPNYSPAPQITAQFGDLIAPPNAYSQANSDHPARIIHHPTQTPGEKVASPVGCISEAQCTFTPESPIEITIPTRPLRRGRPPLIDDIAKGRLLGLISLGLSFRQAAAQLGVHHAAILKLLQRDEEFAQQVAEARLDAISQPLLSVVKASRTNWRAAAWLANFLDRRRTSSYESTPEERELERKRI